MSNAASNVLLSDTQSCRSKALRCCGQQRRKLVALAAGMLCTLSWARERGFEDADIPLHVYGPPGLADYIRSGPIPSPIALHPFVSFPPQPLQNRMVDAFDCIKNVQGLSVLQWAGWQATSMARLNSRDAVSSRLQSLALCVLCCWLDHQVRSTRLLKPFLCC